MKTKEVREKLIQKTFPFSFVRFSYVKKKKSNDKTTNEKMLLLRGEETARLRRF